MKRPITLFFAVFVASLLSAQEPASLPTASNISKGVLPNGISYYIVTNPNDRGYADFALIQQGKSGAASARDALVSLPDFSKIRPYRYLASKGVGYRKEGYIGNPLEAAVFRFEDVPVYDRNVADSTLLLIFNIMRTSPMEQALIVSGDFDRDKLFQQVQMLSLSVPVRQALSELPVYLWEPVDTMSVVQTANGTEDIATLTLTYKSQRPARSIMNTTRPVLSRMYAVQLGEILGFRIKQSFKTAGIPLADLASRYTDSSETSGDEMYSMTMTVPFSCLGDALSLLASLLSDIDRNGVTPDEMQKVRQIVRTDMDKASGREIRTNEEYVDRCVASYLYGANLASTAAVNNYFAGRNLDSETELGLFNRYCSALLSPSSNLTMTLDTPRGDLDADEVRALFAGSWKESSGNYAPRVLPGLPERSGWKKVKVKSTLPDPVTGGEVWTFSNGMKVVYRRTDDSRQFRYAFLLHGGATAVPSLVRGESAFVEDVIKLYGIGGMTAEEYRRFLASSGISMDTELTMTDLRLTGTAPCDRFQTLLQCLAATGYSRKMEDYDYAYYRKCIDLEMKRDLYDDSGVLKKMEEMCSPDYRYPDYKLPENITTGLPAKVEEYLCGLFAKCDDGVIVLVGGLDAAETKAALCRYLGAFATGKRHLGRTIPGYPMRKGWYTYTAEPAPGCDPCINVMVKSFMTVSQRSRMAFRLACDALETSLEKALADKGYSVEVTGKSDLFPAEMTTLNICCRPCPESGLPSGIVPASMTEVLSVVRSAITGLANTPVDPLRLEVYRQSLVHRQESRTSSPEFILQSAIVRNAEGRDIVTGSAGQIKAVGVSDVESVFRALDNGVKVEYIQK